MRQLRFVPRLDRFEARLLLDAAPVVDVGDPTAPPDDGSAGVFDYLYTVVTQGMDNPGQNTTTIPTIDIYDTALNAFAGAIDGGIDAATQAAAADQLLNDLLMEQGFAAAQAP